MKGKTFLSITLSRLIGLMIFLILLIIANVIYINNFAYILIINFLTENIGIIILFSVLFYLGEIFFLLKFPFNLPAPIFNAFGGVFLILFLFGIFYLIGDILGNEIFSAFKYMEPLVYVPVFFLIILFGYLIIFVDLGNRRTREIKEKKIEKEREEFIDWKNFGEELKGAANDVAKNIKETLGPKKSKKKKPVRKTKR